jgi:hypothetical protein
MTSPAYRAPCSIQGPTCLGEVDVNAKHVFRQVIGWVESRQAGGANTVALMEPQQVWACKPCIQARRKGISPAQTTLWGSGT